MKVGDLVIYEGNLNRHLRGMIGVVTVIGKGRFRRMTKVLFPSYKPYPIQICRAQLREVINESR